MEEPYLVPDYFPHFSCKMGACRHPCCEGWPISISMKDYFRLLSVECSPELRRKLDSALHISLHPSEDAYAQILPRYDGVCPLHMEDGRCALHAECGGDALSLVCRLYPRGMRTGEQLECSCANSCEAVLEQLLDWQAPLQFSQLPLETLLPRTVRQHHFNTAGREQEIRLWLIALMQRREYPLAQRLLLMGQALHALEAALLAKDSAQLNDLLAGRMDIPVPEAPAQTSETLMDGLSAMTQLLQKLDQRSNSIHDYGEEALAYWGTPVSSNRYLAACERFAALVPQWETWFEHLLVNHMYFMQFPFQDRPVPLKDEYLSLVAIYALLRSLLIGCLAKRGDLVRAVDVAAAVFRLVDHTSFDLYAAPLLRDFGCDDWRSIRALVTL